jgi:hypothetical protein
LNKYHNFIQETTFARKHEKLLSDMELQQLMDMEMIETEKKAVYLKDWYIRAKGFPLLM